MIHLQQLAKRYGSQILFEELSWHIKTGHRIALVGPNGAGKTTLCKILAGDEQSDHGEVVGAKQLTIAYLRQEVDAVGAESVLERAMQAFHVELELFQRMTRLEMAVADGDETQLEKMGALQARLEQMGAYAIEAKAKKVLGGLGFSDSDIQKPANSFSGGWLMRIELARLLLQEPDLLILDEPTNHLDLPSLEWFEGFLNSFEGTLLVVSHDRWFMNRVVDHVAELSMGRLKLYTGTYDAYLKQREEDLLLLEKQAKQQAREIKAQERFIERFRYKASKAKAVQSRIKALEKVERIEIEDEASQLGAFRFPQPPRSGREVLNLEAIDKSYGELVVYQKLDFNIERGTRMALVGPNGAGKSTLLKIMAGVSEVNGGERIVGHNVSVAYFAQHQVESLNPKNTVYEEMMAGAPAHVVDRIRGILGAFLFTGERINKRVGVLSGGEKNRLALAKLMLEPANLILLDEPTNHLDIVAREVLQNALAQFEGTVVFISHDRHFINGVATEVVEVRRGEVTRYAGDYDYYNYKRLQAGQVSEAGMVDERPGSPKAAAGGMKAEGKGLSRKEKRRKEAELRKVFQQKTKTLKKSLAAAETEIAEIESRLEALVAQQEDPTFFEDSAAVKALYAEQGQLEQKLETAMAVWEQDGTALEQEEAAFKAQLEILE